jgi:hypothetical protein
MAQRTRQLMTKRSRCKCDDADQLSLRICGCGDHEAALRNWDGSNMPMTVGSNDAQVSGGNFKETPLAKAGFTP